MRAHALVISSVRQLLNGADTIYIFILVQYKLQLVQSVIYRQRCKDAKEVRLQCNITTLKTEEQLQVSSFSCLNLNHNG